MGTVLWSNRKPTLEEVAERDRLKLAEVKEMAISDMMAVIRKARLKIYTELPGQDAIYLQKRVEATRYLALPEEPKDLGGFFFLPREVGITADTAYELSQIWLNRGYFFEFYGSLTEGLRAQAEKDILDAASIDEVRQAERTFMASIEASAPFLLG